MTETLDLQNTKEGNKRKEKLRFKLISNAFFFPFILFPLFLSFCVHVDKALRIWTEYLFEGVRKEFIKQLFKM